MLAKNWLIYIYEALRTIISNVLSVLKAVDDTYK